MMISLFHIMLTLFLMILQSSVIPLLFGNPCFDLLIPYIVFLSFKRPFAEAFCAVLLLGIMADSLGAGPFGVYGTLYFWLFLFLRWALRVLHVDKRIFLPLIIAGAVALENLLFMAGMVFGENHPGISGSDLRITGAQIFWSALTGPPAVGMIRLFSEGWQGLIRMLSEEKEPAV